MKYLRNFFKGIAIGIAMLVPGISGGTMAIIFGVYDDLIHSIGCYFEDWKKHTILLFQIGLGGLTGILLFSKLLESAINSYPFVMSFLFIGIICGGLPVLYNKSTVEKRNKVDILFVIIGLIIVWIMSAEPAVTTALMTTKDFMSAVFLFIAGIISAIALILPGISASFMLLTIGLYSVTLNAINNWDILFLIPLGLGAVLGTLATARTIEKLLQRYPSKAYMLILGFVIGSLKPVFPGIPQGLSLIYSGGAFVIGFILVYFISKADVE